MSIWSNVNHWYSSTRMAGAIVALIAWSTAGADAPGGLMVDLLRYPEKTWTTSENPRFCWIVNHPGVDQVQTAYQILVASSRPNLDADNGDLWNSGKNESSQSINVRYEGAALAGRASAFWKVRTWDKGGAPSPYSQSQQFNMQAIAGVPANRYRVEDTAIASTRIVNLGAGHYFIEFPRAAFGTLQVTLTSQNGGETVGFGLGEKQTGDMVSTNPGGDVRYAFVDTVLSQGTQTYRLLVPRGGWGGGQPDLLYPCIPFRYAELTNVPGNLQESDVRMMMVQYPFDDSASSFTSSNQTLNAVWDLCKYTIKATSWLGIYVDGDRERTPYEADAYINQLSHYGVDCEYQMARYTFDYLMLNQQWPTEWRQHAILYMWADYMATGDTSLIGRGYSHQNFANVFPSTSRVNPDGLINCSTNGWGSTDIVDWPSGYRDDFDFRAGSASSVVSAFHYRTLLNMADITERLGKPTEAQTYRAKAQGLPQAFDNALFNASLNRYVDCEGSAHASLHANFFPLALGVVPAARAPQIGDYLVSRGMNCSVYGAQYLLEALYAQERDQHALDLMTSATTWPKMIQFGSTITTETWESSSGDWNHAWASAPANIIPRYLMGVQPLEPGYGKIQIAPQTADLSSCSITVPTVRGPIRVSCQLTSSAYSVSTTIPANTTARVLVAKRESSGTEVIVDGIPRNGTDMGAFVAFDSIGSGTHTFVRSLTGSAAGEAVRAAVPAIRVSGKREGVAISLDTRGVWDISIYSLAGRCALADRGSGRLHRVIPAQSLPSPCIVQVRSGKTVLHREMLILKM